MEVRTIIFDGEEKKVFATEDPGKVIIRFSDNATAFEGIKKAVIKGKAKANCTVSSIVYQELAKAGVPTQYLETLSETEQLCTKLDVLPLLVSVRNRLAGSAASLLGKENGVKIPNTIFEVRFQNSLIGNPLINEHYAVAMGIASYEEMDQIKAMALKINEVVSALFHKAGIELVDFRIKFGRDAQGQLLLADELGADNCRLWDEKDQRVLDKDRFRHDLSDVCATYREVMDRLTATQA